MKLDRTQPVHPLIAEYIAIFGGEPVEVSAEGVCRYSGNTHPSIYYPMVENLQSTLDRTGGQGVLFIEDGVYRIEHPFTGSVIDPPPGSFYRFAAPKPEPDALYRIRRMPLFDGGVA